MVIQCVQDLMMEDLFIYLFFSSLFSILLCFCSQDKIDMTENDYVGLCESALVII